MDERAALAWLADRMPAAGDDAAVVGEHVLTTDMLHERTDFPVGTTRYTAGWRSAGASLSDIAAMGAEAVAVVAAYGAPDFDGLEAYVDGVQDVCQAVDAEYVGGDLDSHDEFTVVTSGLGRAASPVYRDGATEGDVVCVTGSLGRTGAALELFRREDTERANDLFRFPPRVHAGRALAGDATAMMDISDGLARSAHQLAAASDCGLALASPLPIDESVDAVTDSPEERRELGLFIGEDFELLCTLPPDRVSAARERCPCSLTTIGRVTATGITLDGDPLADRGYSHRGSAGDESGY